MSLFDSIDQALGTTYVKQDNEIVVPKDPKTPILVKNDYSMIITQSKEEINQNFAQDYEFIRDTLKALMLTGVESLEIAKDLAEGTESPRAFEVCTSIINTVAGLGKELTNLHEKALKIAGDDKPNNAPTVNGNIVQNNFYGGSEKELQAELDKVIEVEFDDKDLE